ncbi:MAG TPA: protein kinase [Candidatus Eisenbacteria bacterium]|nr:protein kinase [Candidatus Eisenbacteria bacterium]
MPVCSACGREVPAARFCPECGVALSNSPAIGPTAESPTIPDTPGSRPPSSHPSSSVHGRFDPGTRLGSRYRVVGLLGRGGMGEVYRADDLELNQSVALKFLPESVSRNAGDLARLRGEVRTARQIAHPNVCRTYDISEADGQVFVVMEYVDGEDLASVLRRLGRPSSDKALEIARQLCLGLGAAHENGVIHRDLKPANVMIDGRGRVRITDFGLAGTAEEIAAERGSAGTPAYMAPEQARSGAASPQSDIYSLGLVLYEVFTGKRASDMRPRPDPARPSTDSSVRTPSSLVPDIDPAVERVILRCLEQDPARRPQSAYAVFGALPGGDPLAAAVAAGETPSPELVANAGAEGSVRPIYAGIAVLFVVAGLVAISIIQRPYLSGLDRSPQVLSVRAEEMLRQATGKAPPRFSSDGFRYAPVAKDSASGADSLVAARPRVQSKPARAKQYWRRWSPSPLEVMDIHIAGSTVSDPPQTYPGSGTLVFDPGGRLLALSIVPDAAPDSAAREAVDWAGVLRAAGRDPAGAVPVPLPRGFAVQADTIAAWRISATALAETTLAVAAFEGKITRVDTFAGRNALGDLVVRKSDDPGPQDWMFLILLVVIPVVGSIVLARHNVRGGRGDLRGALFIGISVLVLYLLEYLFAVNLGELGFLRILDGLMNQAPLGHALIHGVFLSLAYLAIEPYVRRLWPGMLVSWARLVAGRLRDPIVGRDILVGGVWGVAGALLAIAHAHLPLRLGLVTDPVLISAQTLGTLLGPQALISTTTIDLAIAALNATIYLTLFVILRFVLRGNRAAAIGMVIIFVPIFMGSSGKAVWLDMAYGLAVSATLLGVALRYGYLALIAGSFLGSLASDLPFTTDLGAWFAPQVLLGWAVVAAMMIYGFLTAVGGRSLFRDPLGHPGTGVPDPARPR